MHCSKETTSLDRLVEADQYRQRHFQSECLRAFEVDHQLELGWQDDRQVGRLRALEDLAGVKTGLAVRIGNAGSVAYQPAGHGELPQEVHRRQRVARRQRAKTIAPAEIQRVAADEEREVVSTGEARE